MDKKTCSDVGVLLEKGPDTAKIEHSSSAGTYALRRAIYFNKTEGSNKTGESDADSRTVTCLHKPQASSQGN